MNISEVSAVPSPLGDIGEAAMGELTAKFGKDFSRALSLREQHSGLEGHHLIVAPEAVVFPKTTDEVSWLVRWCGVSQVPLIAHGAGTSLEGHLSAVRGGVSMDLSRMNRIIEVETDDLLCTVEAGTTRENLNLYLRDQGLFFPVDPGADATLGGMAATRASGTNAVRYGTMRDNVLSTKVVLADGRVIQTGTRAAKSSAGYDLTGLFVGSEGTLGILTEVTLRLFGIPEVVLAATCAFETLEGAVRSVILAVQLGIPVARIELLDEHQISACNLYSGLDLPERHTLFIEFHGSPRMVDEAIDQLQGIASELGGGLFQRATQAQDRSRLWKARHEAYYAAKNLIPNSRVWTSDVCVPIASLAESILATRAEIEYAGIPATIVGHVGDGNYHVMFVLDPTSPDAHKSVQGINDRMVSRAIALGGTCTGEHGIGLGKRQCLIDERGSNAVALMASIKQLLDPGNILNPGKVFHDA